MRRARPVPGRRAFLGGLAAVSVGGALAAAPSVANAVTTLGAGQTPSAARNLARPKQGGPLAITLVNNTGAYQNSSISFAIVGTDISDDAGRHIRVTPEGEKVPVSTADNGPDGYADYAIEFPASGEAQISLPSEISGRIYVAIDGDLAISIVEGDRLALPAGWVSTDPNNAVLHDNMEFTYSEGRMYCNTTMVDMFSVPMKIELEGEESPSTGELVPGGRDAIFSAVSDQSGFGNLVTDLRVVAPGHGIGEGLFDANYFDGYVDEVWNTYEGTDMVVNANNQTFTGRVQGGQFVFDGDVQPFDKPSTTDVLFCDGALAAPNDGITGPVAAVLGSGFNRSTLVAHADQPVTDPAQFYTNDVANHYARVMHENSVDGKAYGFAFDDVSGFASYIEDNATAMRLTLTEF